MSAHPQPSIAVVIPCYRVSAQILGVIERIGPDVGWIIVVDDACPEHSGDIVEKGCPDQRVTVLRHIQNRGVGAAVTTGYAVARDLPVKVVVKLDGDGQMDPALISRLAAPLLEGRADYVKGNRFYRLSDTAEMPRIRLIGNACLSFLTKLSSGYWQLFDPTNGFTAIHRSLLAELDFGRIAPRYFFESDMLYHLNQLRAVIMEMPMPASYSGEPSSLRPLGTVGPFLSGNLRNLCRRVVYTYFVRGFSLASVELSVGCPLVAFSLLFGASHWWISATQRAPATAGTVMLAALPFILGIQFILSWLSFDIATEPRHPVHPYLESEQSSDSQFDTSLGRIGATFPQQLPIKVTDHGSFKPTQEN